MQSKWNLLAVAVVLLAVVTLAARFNRPGGTVKAIVPPPDAVAVNEAPTALATFGGGCFWCTEAVFQRIKGVKGVVSGYAGGTVDNPTYEQICTGKTGHAEVIQVTYDPAVVSYETLLHVFWQTHDPTTLNRQGHDSGTQYRSIILAHDESQRKIAEEYKAKIDISGVFDAPLTTEVVPLVKFYPAEDYHQNYYAENGLQPYCQAVIGPKLKKLNEVFGDKMK